MKSASADFMKELAMKSHRKELWFHVPTRRAFLNITPQVQDALRESGIEEGIVLVAKGTTSLQELQRVLKS